MPTVSEILTLAPIAGYLAQKDIDKANKLSRSLLNQVLPQQIHSVWFYIKRVYSINPLHEDLEECANYLWALMGNYGELAQGVSGSGGYVTPITPANPPNELHFEVDGSSPILSGGTTLDLSTYNYIGYNILFVRNNVPQSTIEQNGATYYSWNKATAILTLLNGAAQTEDLFDIYPIR